MTRKKPHGFGPEDIGGFSPHPCSLDAAALQLARIGAVRVDPTESLQELPNGTICWSFLKSWNSAEIQAINEEWFIELTLCDCCPGITAWSVKRYVDNRSGLFFQFDMDVWEGIEKAIETARHICIKYASSTV